MFSFWGFSLFSTVMLYSILYDCRILCIWFCFFVGYLSLGYLQGGWSMNTNRSKFRIGTWNSPTDPNCYVKLEVNLKRVGLNSTRWTSSSRRRPKKASS